MGRLLSSRGCPRCRGMVYLEGDPWDESNEYMVCWRCGHILSEREERVIELMTLSRLRETQERRNQARR